MEAIKRQYTVWDFESPSSGERKRVALVSEVDDVRYAHQYQRIVAQVLAFGPDDALRAAAQTKGGA